MVDTDHKVFLSYRRSDSSDLVRGVENALGERGVPTFRDIEIPVGGDYRKVISAAWRSAGAFVVFLSPNYTDSPVLLMELGAAFGSGVPVIPVLLADAPLPADLWQFQVIDGRNMTPEQIADAIKQALEQSPAAVSA
jgi:TIR domain